MKTASDGASNTDEGLTRNLARKALGYAYRYSLSPRNEAVIAASPQLAAVDAFATYADITLELADLSIGQLSAVAALMLSLDAAEARARSAELKLAAHCAPLHLPRSRRGRGRQLRGRRLRAAA